MSAFDRNSTAEQVSEGVDLAGKRAIVTGANTGIGLETSRVLALRGARVTMACRSLEKARQAREGLIARGASPDQLALAQLDLASLDSVRRFASKMLAGRLPIDLLVNNAGVMLPDRRETSDGFEAHFGVNHLGHFLLTNLLLDRLRESAPARVVVVASDAMHFAALGPELEDLNWEKRKFSGWRSYGSSKLMNLLFSDELNRRLGGQGVVAHALHPGIVRTELARDQPWWMHAVGLVLRPLSKDCERGAATTMFVATAADLAEPGGGYFSDCAPARRPKLAEDAETAARLWDRSCDLVGL
jgi:NAD(P)-dependent dehydrogenase (short-subunit alcohol dehydrogenase family)